MDNSNKSNWYFPHGWTVLKLQDEYKIFGTWRGGYLDGDSWRFNSGVEFIEEDKYHYYFVGYSKSVYKCEKHLYDNHSVHGLSVLSELVGKSEWRRMSLEEVKIWLGDVSNPLLRGGKKIH